MGGGDKCILWNILADLLNVRLKKLHEVVAAGMGLTSPPLPCTCEALFYRCLFLVVPGGIFVAVHGLSLVAASRSYSQAVVRGFLLQRLLLLRLLGSRAQARLLWHTGSVA